MILFDKTMTHSKPKVLVEAYECSPARSHAPGSAWQILSRLARSYDLWIITEQTQYRDEVTEHLEKDPALAEAMNFHFIPRLKKGGFGRRRPALPIREILEYRGWLQRSLDLALALHSKVGFDLAHHLRSNTFREPGYLWKLPVPFVWGPTGGTTLVPWSMLMALGWRGLAEYTAKNLINALQLRFSWRLRRALHNAECIIAQTTQDQENFRKIHGLETMLAHEQASEPSMGKCRSYDGTRKLNIAWIGRCITGKAMPILLKAMCKQEIKGRTTLHIAGDGPCLAKWQRMAQELGIAEQCRWHGWLEQQKTLDLLNNCDVLAFTSLLDATSTTVMQSLSLGVPVICLKHCDFGDVITDECGIAIPVKDMFSAIEDFSVALGSILQNPQRLKVLSKGALSQAGKYSWDHLAQQIKEAYDIALAKPARSEAPKKIRVPMAYFGAAAR